MSTKKKTDKMTEKFDFSDSLKAVKDTAKTMNTQVREVAGEMAEDLRESGEELKDMALEPVKKVYKKVSERVTMDRLAKATKEVNAYTLKTAEEIVDGVIENSEKWQGIAGKAMKGGLKLAAKQQEIVFDALEAVKDQLSKSAVRFKKLF